MAYIEGDTCRGVAGVTHTFGYRPAACVVAVAARTRQTTAQKAMQKLATDKLRCASARARAVFHSAAPEWVILETREATGSPANHIRDTGLLLGLGEEVLGLHGTRRSDISGAAADNERTAG